MPKKIGNGGNGLEKYNELTGEYEKDAGSSEFDNFVSTLKYPKDDFRYIQSITDFATEKTGSYINKNIFGENSNDVRLVDFCKRLCFLNSQFPLDNPINVYPSSYMPSGLMAVEVNISGEELYVREMKTNSRYFYQLSNEQLKSILLENMEKGFHSKHSEKDLYTYFLDHEYGHIISTQVINRLGVLKPILQNSEARYKAVRSFVQENPQFDSLSNECVLLEMGCRQVLSQIEINPDDISTYGKTSPGETFAELFASALSEYPTQSAINLINYVRSVLYA